MAKVVVSEPAVPGRRKTLGPLVFLDGLEDRPKNPEFRRYFFSLVKTSSEGVREWEGRRSGEAVAEDGLKTLRLFLRSFLPRRSDMAGIIDILLLGLFFWFSFSVRFCALVFSCLRWVDFQGSRGKVSGNGVRVKQK